MLTSYKLVMQNIQNAIENVLKEFEIEGRDITYHYLYESDSPYCDYYKKAKEILERAWQSPFFVL